MLGKTLLKIYLVVFTRFQPKTMNKTNPNIKLYYSTDISLDWVKWLNTILFLDFCVFIYNSIISITNILLKPCAILTNTNTYLIFIFYTENNTILSYETCFVGYTKSYEQNKLRIYY